MKLEGSLDAFGLPDVLHLLHATSKTGALHLTRQGSGAVVHLIDGAVASGVTVAAGHLALLRRLVGQGLVDEDMVASAAMAAAETGAGLVATLVSHDLMAGDIAQAQMHQLIVDTLFDVVRWDDGDFSFAAEELPTDDVGVRQPPAVLVDEATMRLPAWESAADHVPSPFHVPGLIRSQSQELSVSPEDWSLLALIDGQRTVDGIVAEAGIGAFAVVVRLADLSERGYIELCADHQTAGARQAARREILSMLDAAEGLEADLQPAAPVVELGFPDDPAPTDPIGQAGGATVVAVPVSSSAPASSSVPTGSSGADTPAVPTASGADPEASLLGGAHQPGDVVPTRPEPFRPSRRPEHPEGGGLSSGEPGDTALHVEVIGANAVVASTARHDESSATASTVPLNRSMVLRLIAGVRGL